MTQNPSAHIHLHQLELNVTLGVTEAERAQPQPVWINIDIGFPAPPKACFTDQLADTYCYDTLTQKIAEDITPRSFQLLEHLAQEIYLLIKKTLTHSLSVDVKVTKKPVLSSSLVITNASFSFGDS